VRFSRVIAVMTRRTFEAPDLDADLGADFDMTGG
jgi:hypothetical protein